MFNLYNYLVIFINEITQIQSSQPNSTLPPYPALYFNKYSDNIPPHVCEKQMDITDKNKDD